MQFEAPDCSEKGIATFCSSVIENSNHISRLTMYGAYEGEKICGVIATRNNGSHIALLFVDGKYHRQGIGKKLFHEAIKSSSGNRITVNSSPFAVPIYHRLGFFDTAHQQNTERLIYTPMEYIKTNHG